MQTMNTGHQHSNSDTTVASDEMPTETGTRDLSEISQYSGRDDGELLPSACGTPASCSHGCKFPPPPPPAAAGQTVSKTAEVSGVSAGWP